jgi:hypothetical protein
MARGTFAAGLVVAIGLMLVSCTKSALECDCVDTALEVSIPDDRAADVESVTPSGPACTGLTATCSSNAPSGPCDMYGVAPNATGNCYIAVVFSSGAAMFTSQTSIVEGPACCGEFAAYPPSGADIDVPDDTSDSGTNGGDL